MKILLMGYYGYGNIGDDLFVKQLTTYLSNQSFVEEVLVICQNNYYEKVSEKVSFFSSQQLSKIKRISLLLKSNYIAWGGGSLSLGTKPNNLLRIQVLAKLMGKRFCFLGVGLETVKSKSEESTVNVFDKADFLYVRDNYSYSLALEKLKSVKSCCLGGDLAFLNLAYYEPFIKKNKNSNHLSNISFSGKFWWGESRAEFYAKQLMPLIDKYNSVIHLLPGHTGDERNDNRFHELLKKYLPEENCKIHLWHKPEDFIQILNQMDLHIGNRLHSVILADILGIPNIGISNSPAKISNYIDKTEILSRERVADFMEPLIIERMEKIWQEYEKPEAFINKESQTAKECLIKLFQK